MATRGNRERPAGPSVGGPVPGRAHLKIAPSPVDNEDIRRARAAPSRSSPQAPMYLKIDSLREGMRLLSEVTDAQGRRLIPAGQELTERHIAVLERMGIASVDVEVDPMDAPADPRGLLDPEALEAVKAELDETFRHADPGDAWVEALRELGFRDRAARRAREKAT